MSTSSTTVPSQAPRPPATNMRAALAVATSIFFMWGFLTALNDILIPHLKAVFELNYTRVMLVQFTFFGAYFLTSLPAGKLVAWLGYKQGIVAGLVIAGIGALGFWPAAASHQYAAFLTALFVLATGITVLQVAANPYVAMLGPERTSSSRLTLAQALNSLGTAIAPLFGGIVILGHSVKSSADIALMPLTEQVTYRAHQAQSVQGPYIGLAVALFVLALFVFVFRMPSLKEKTDQADNKRHSYFDALRHRHLLFGVIGIFCYVGAEVSIGSFMVNYLALPQIGNIDAKQATNYVAAYWTMAMIGRFASSVLLVRFSPRRLLALFAGVNMLLLALTMSSTGTLALYTVVATGLFNSLMFPTIFALGIERLGPLTNKASSLLIMAIVGGAVVPLLQGVLADHIGVHHSFILPLMCYAYIIFYGLSGSRPNVDRQQGS